MADLKERILKEMVIHDEDAWQLAKEIYENNRNRLKPSVSLATIYDRIVELKKDG